MNASATPTVTYREDRWWGILAAIGDCFAVSPWAAWTADAVTFEVARSGAVDDYWTVAVRVDASFHSVVSKGRRPAYMDGARATVTVHEVHQ